MTKNGRLDHLDGLRGVAALAVIAFHFLAALTPWLVPTHHGHAHWIAYTPLAVLWNGPFAVAVFFVLSGFVLTGATLRKSDPLWVDLVIRYLRLAVPATLSVILGWGLLKIFPTSATELAGKTGSAWLAYTYQGAIPPLLDALYNGTVGLFVSGGSFYNNALWTMRPEFIGSILCFLVCCFSTPRMRVVAALLAAILIVFIQRFEYECFVLGILMREAWAAGRLPVRFPVVALSIGLLLGSQSGDAAETLGLTWLPRALTPEGRGGLLYPMAAALVVYGCIRSDGIARFLASAFGRFVGSISFPIYILHVPVIYTVFASLCVAVYPSYAATTVLIAVTIVALVGLAYAVEMYVERPFLRRLGRLRTYLGRRNPTRMLKPRPLT